MTINLKDFFLGTPLEDCFEEYICIPVHVIPAEIMALYELQKLVTNNFVYAEV
jgi:hypothetical protein